MGCFTNLSPNRSSSIVWIRKILSLFRIRPPLFSAIRIYGLCTNAQPRVLGYLLTLPPLAIIHKRLHPLLPRLVKLGIIPAFVTDQQDADAYKEHHRCRVCKADHPILHCTNVIHRFPRNESYSTTPLTLQPL